MIFVKHFALSQNVVQNIAPVTLLTPFPKPAVAGVFTKNDVVVSKTAVPFLSANYYAARLGFFCKQELKFEKVVKIPFKFRLGSVDDCDKLEGKRNWHK